MNPPGIFCPQFLHANGKPCRQIFISFVRCRIFTHSDAPREKSRRPPAPPKIEWQACRLTLSGPLRMAMTWARALSWQCQCQWRCRGCPPDLRGVRGDGAGISAGANVGANVVAGVVASVNVGASVDGSPGGNVGAKGNASGFADGGTPNTGRKRAGNGLRFRELN